MRRNGGGRTEGEWRGEKVVGVERGKISGNEGGKTQREWGGENTVEVEPGDDSSGQEATIQEDDTV